MKWIIILLIIIVVLYFLGKKKPDNNTEKKNNERSQAPISTLQEKEQLTLHLNAIYETYLEMKEKNMPDLIIAITLYPTTSRISESKYLAVGISIQFDGTWFWPYIKNDFIPSLYEVGLYEEFRDWKTVGSETGSWESVSKKIEKFLQDYKVVNADKGEYLDLISVQEIKGR